MIHLRVVMFQLHQSDILFSCFFSKTLIIPVSVRNQVKSFANDRIPSTPWGGMVVLAPGDGDLITQRRGSDIPRRSTRHPRKRKSRSPGPRRSFRGRLLTTTRPNGALGQNGKESRGENSPHFAGGRDGLTSAFMFDPGDEEGLAVGFPSTIDGWNARGAGMNSVTRPGLRERRDQKLTVLPERLDGAIGPAREGVPDDS